MENRTTLLKLESGAEYKVSWDDGCVRLEGVTHLEPKVLPLLMEYAWENKLEDLRYSIEKEQRTTLVWQEANPPQ